MNHKHGLWSIILTGAALAMTLGEIRAEKPFSSYPQAARERFAQAEDSREKGQYPEALAAYDDAIQRGLEGYARVYLRKADCHRHLREHAKVVAAYTVLIEDLGLERSCWVCMVTALRGRAAAFVALGDLERALADLTTVVLLHEQDLAVRVETKAGELSEILPETAKAHRDRARVLMDRARWSAARVDVERADEWIRKRAAREDDERDAVERDARQAARSRGSRPSRQRA